MRAAFEARLLRERAREEQLGALKRMVAETNILAGHGRASDRVERLRLQREESEIAQSIATEKRLISDAQNAARRAAVAALEQEAAEQMEQQTGARVREEQLRKRVCESSDELKVLKQKLNAARTARDRAAQLLELQVRAEERQQEDERFEEAMERERLRKLQDERKVEIEKELQREKAKDVQLSQIRAKEEQKLKALEEHEREKYMVDAIVDKIRVEDEREAHTRRNKQLETREHLQSFMIEQAELRRAKAEREKEEERKIDEFAAKKRAFEEAIAAERAAKEDAKRKILNAMLERQEAKNKASEELEQLRNELHMEELEAKMRAKEEEDQRRRVQERILMLAAYEDEMRIREERRRASEAEEQKFRELLMAKFAEDDRIEQLNAQRRRLKVEAHRREAERLIEERRALYGEERRKEVEEYRKLKEFEDYKEKIIQDEKERLLKNFGKDLRNFLPKGTLSKPEDLALISNSQ